MIETSKMLTLPEALPQKQLEKAITEIVIDESPLLSITPILPVTGLSYEYAVVISTPSAFFEGEAAQTISSRSEFERRTVTMKIIRAKAGVTGIAQAVASGQLGLDLLKSEMLRAARAIRFLIEWCIFYGKASADIYQFDGIPSLVENVLHVKGPVELGVLDEALDISTPTGTEGDPRRFLVSHRMLSAISGKLVRVQRVITDAEVESAIRVQTHRGVPFLPHNLMGPSAKSPVVRVSDSSEAGKLVPEATYKWRISGITKSGEQIASDVTTHKLGVGITSAKLSWSETKIGKEDVYLWKIWRSPAGGTEEKLVTTISAWTYKEGRRDMPVTEYIDKAADGELKAEYPLLDGEEQIYLVNFSRENGMALCVLTPAFSEGKLENFVNVQTLAKVKDAQEFLLSVYCALIIKMPKTFVRIRNVKLG
jgi:hypothetical protein